ncbi:hypothetical protein BASA60_004347 [Batrachochytrium salamandrivorans]|nr:hypothetical protein BASA60_004347 [Batrachochytrium salamandrivorans]
MKQVYLTAAFDTMVAVDIAGSRRPPVPLPSKALCLTPPTPIRHGACLFLHPPSTTSLSALHAVRSRRSSLFQTGGSLITQPLKPYSAAHSPAQGPRSISPRRAPPSPRTYQGSEGHTQDLQLYGWALLVFTIMYFSFNFVMIFGSKMLFPTQTGYKVLDWILDDHYYCYLIPILGPVFVFIIFFNWLGMKYFRQNA